jgi:ADP-heptose:LPS heptosyltransferase
MPSHVIKHVLDKYGPTGKLFHVGESPRDLGIPKIKTKTLWDLAKTISEARLFIGVDSGPSWIAACFPDIVIKKLRTRPAPEEFKTWVPLHEDNIHSFWDDRLHHVFNPTEDDIGFTYSYRRL